MILNELRHDIKVAVLKVVDEVENDGHFRP